MKKISKVEFNNFRAFKGNETLDFENEAGEIADFICIYGQNGMGKTSFFDGIEWFSYGGIHKFKDKDISKELKKYKGSILKNRGAGDENAYVRVIFSDGKSAKRTTSNSSRSNNDYLKGSIAPKTFKNIISENQILPHSKIDNFVYATSPIEKYKQWGDFWDLDGKQRELFNKVYLLNKACNKKVSDLKIEIENIKEEIEELSIIDEKIENINNNIALYNKNSNNEEEIKLIEKHNNKIINIPDNKEIDNKKSNLISLKEDITLKNNKIIYLIKFYNEYYNEEKKLIDKKINKIKVELLKKAKLYEAGEGWLNQYLDHKNLIFQIKEKDQILKLSKINLNRLIEEKNSINENIKVNLDLNDKLLKNSDYIFNTAIKIENFKKKFIDLSKRKIEINKYIHENKFLKEKYLILIDNLENFKYNNQKIEFYTHISSLSYVEDEIYKYKNIYEVKSNYLYKEINEIDNKIIEKEKMYIESKKNYSNLEESLIKIKDYIYMNNSKTCPVCKTEFGNVNELISKINLNDYQKVTEKIYLELEKLKKLKNYKIDEKSIMIKSWNQICQKKIDEIARQITDKSDEILKKEKLLLDIENQIITINEKIKEFKEYLLKFGEYKGDFSRNSLEVWVNNLKVIYNERLQKENIILTKFICEINDIKSKINKLDNDIKLLSNKYDSFIENDENKELVIILSNISDINWSVFKKYYEDLKDEYNSYLERLDLVNLKLAQYTGLPIEIMDYKIENYFNIDMYKEYYTQIYIDNNISYNNMVFDFKKNKDTIKNLEFKINILNYIINESSITEYNRKYYELYKELNKIKKSHDNYKKSEKKIKEIFTDLKVNLELNIEKVFGSKVINQIYKIIEPNKEFTELKSEVNFNENDIPELYIKGKNSELDKEIIPEYFFSSAQLNTVALSIFFAGALSLPNLRVKTIFIDDPVGHFDDINVLAFVDLLRNIVRDGQWQIVVSTHDESFYNLLKNKISNEFYNSKFLKFSSIGRVKNDNFNLLKK